MQHIFYPIAGWCLWSIHIFIFQFCFGKVELVPELCTSGSPFFGTPLLTFHPVANNLDIISKFSQKHPGMKAVEISAKTDKQGLLRFDYPLKRKIKGYGLSFNLMRKNMILMLMKSSFG